MCPAVFHYESISHGEPKRIAWQAIGSLLIVPRPARSRHTDRSQTDTQTEGPADKQTAQARQDRQHAPTTQQTKNRPRGDSGRPGRSRISRGTRTKGYKGGQNCLTALVREDKKKYVRSHVKTYKTYTLNMFDSRVKVILVNCLFACLLVCLLARLLACLYVP